MDKERFVAAARNLAGEKGKQKNETPRGMWLSGARIGSLYLFYAGPLAGRQKSGISDDP